MPTKTKPTSEAGSAARPLGPAAIYRVTVSRSFAWRGISYGPLVHAEVAGSLLDGLEASEHADAVVDITAV